VSLICDAVTQGQNLLWTVHAEKRRPIRGGNLPQGDKNYRAMPANIDGKREGPSLDESKLRLRGSRKPRGGGDPKTQTAVDEEGEMKIGRQLSVAKHSRPLL